MRKYKIATPYLFIIFKVLYLLLYFVILSKYLHSCVDPVFDIEKVRRVVMKIFRIGEKSGWIGYINFVPRISGSRISLHMPHTLPPTQEEFGVKCPNLHFEKKTISFCVKMGNDAIDFCVCLEWEDSHPEADSSIGRRKLQEVR